MKKQCFYLLVCLSCLVSKAFAKDYVTICQDGGQFGSQLTSYAMVLGYAWTHDKIAIFSKELMLQAMGGKLNYERVFYRLPRKFPENEKINQGPLYHVRGYSSIGAIPLQFIPGNVCLCGVTHEICYFDIYKDRIRNLFAPTQEIINEIKKKYNSILVHPKTVAVHIRTYHPRLELHCFLGLKYFETAMNYFDKEHLFIIFSDRIDWCKSHLNLEGKNAIFIEGNDHIIDFYLMSLCKNIITSNSTYSWWAAYLKSNDGGLVIAPSRWFYDPHDANPYLNRAMKKFYPKEWIIIPVDSPQRDWSLVNYKSTSIQEK